MCGASEFDPYLEKPGLRLVRCRCCAMVFIREVEAGYASGEYYDRLGQEYYLSPDKLESDYAPVRFEREIRLFRRCCTSGRVLDVGCSTGGFLWQLGQQFPGAYDLLGTDTSGPALDYAESRGLAVVRGDFVGHDFGNSRLDAVTLWAVLEHLAEPRAFVEKAGAILKPGGICIMLAPNLESLAVRILGERYRYVYPQHLNYFTRQTLVQLADKWFAPAEVRTTHFNPIVIWQDWRRGGAEVSNPERGRLLKRTTAYKQNRWLSPLKAGYRLVEKALGATGLADNVAVVLRRKG